MRGMTVSWADLFAPAGSPRHGHWPVGYSPISLALRVLVVSTASHCRPDFGPRTRHEAASVHVTRPCRSPGASSFKLLARTPRRLHVRGAPSEAGVPPAWGAQRCKMDGPCCCAFCCCAERDQRRKRQRKKENRGGFTCTLLKGARPAVMFLFQTEENNVSERVAHFRRHLLSFCAASYCCACRSTPAWMCSCTCATGARGHPRLYPQSART